MNLKSTSKAMYKMEQKVVIRKYIVTLNNISNNYYLRT